MVQSRLFQNLSDPLDARIPSEQDDGRWQNPVSEIEDVEWDVFAGLAEFAYTRDYVESLRKVQYDLDGEGVEGLENGKKEITPPLNDSIVQPALAAEAPAEEATADGPSRENDDGWSSLSSTRVKKQKKKKSPEWPEDEQASISASIAEVPMATSTAKMLWQQFSNISKKLPRSSKAAQTTVKECSTSATLLYHAKLCVLANRYLIPSLQDQCLKNLHKALTNLEFDLSKVNALLDLVQLVYTEDGVQEIADLKHMVLLYVAAKIGILRQDDRLRAMMQDIGQLGADLVYTMSGVGDWS